MTSKKQEQNPEGGHHPHELIEQMELVEVQDNRHGQFHRSFTPRQVHIISLGSNMGSGLFIGTGKALFQGGPANMVIAYFLVCTGVWATIQTLSEMTIAFPTSGNYIDYADRWCDPALAFGAGFAEWLGWTAVYAAEAVFFDVLLRYWAGDGFPLAASLTIFTVAVYAIFSLPNKVFAWFEYATSLIKIFLFFLIVTLSLALIGGAGPGGHVHDGSYWRDLPAFKNGFAGFSNCALLAIWAVGDQIFIGVIGGEAQNPRFSMAHAAKIVPYRVLLVFMSIVTFITILVPADDERLFGGSDVSASPFVIALDNASIPGLPDLINACIIVGVMGIAAECIYLSSRVLRTMAHQGLIPAVIANVDAKGRPRLALLVTCGVGTILTYINLSAGGITVFNWLISITSASFFINWMVVAVSSWRFHKALKAQQDPLFSQLYAWRSTAWPLAPVWLMTISLLLLVCCVYAGIVPPTFSVESFFQQIIGALLISGSTLAYKLIFQTPWRDARTADCVTGRRSLTDDDIRQLDEYYALPKYKRVFTYVQLW
ncbi:proline-specific permease [Aspergillus floccosus]